MSEESGRPRIGARTPGSGAPRLLDQVREAIRRRYFSRRTEQAYVHWTRRFIYFHGKRHPRDLGEAEVTAFLNDLALGCPSFSRAPRSSGSSRNSPERAGCSRA